MREWINWLVLLALYFACVLLCASVSADEWKPVTTMAPIGQSEVDTKVIRLTSDQPIPEAVRLASQSVCRVRIYGNDGSQYMGSGAYVGERTVVTARHVMDGGSLPTTTVEFSTRSYRTSGWLANRSADQYLIQITETPTIRPIPFATVQPAPGETVWVMGFGHDTFAIWPARLTGFGSAKTQMDSGFYAGKRARSGDSGGAIINSRGEYIGTIWGGGGNDAVAVTYTQTRSFFQRTGLLARLFGRRGTVVSSTTTSCTTGTCPPQSQGYYPPPDYYQTPTPDPVPNQPAPAPQIDESAIADRVAEMLRNDPSLKGPPGIPGAPGRDGRDGKDGQDGSPGISLPPITTQAKFTERQVEELRDEILSSVTHPGQRVILVDGSTGSVIDDETYQAGEPIVLDFQRIINAAKQR